KPSLSTEYSASGLQFNLSHSHELALLAAVKSRKIGIDVEHLRDLPNAEAIAGRFFTVEEREALARLPAPNRTAAFFICWTRKEALLKSTGEGLSKPIDTWNVSHDLSGSAGSVAVACRTCASLVWELTDLRPADGYVGACAVEGTGCALTTFE